MCLSAFKYLFIQFCIFLRKCDSAGIESKFFLHVGNYYSAELQSIPVSIVFKDIMYGCIF